MTGIMDDSVTLRAATRTESTWTVGSAVLSAAAATFWITRLAAAEPVAARVLASAALIAGPLAILASLRLPRADTHRAPALRELVPPAAQRRLRRELWAGRPGPPETWPFAWSWAAVRLQARRTNPGWSVFLAGFYLEVFDYNSGPSWSGWLVASALVLLLLALGEAVLNQRAARVARALVDAQPTHAERP